MTTGDLATRRGAGDLAIRAEWNNGVTLRPPPVCTGRGGRWVYARGWEPSTLRAASTASTRPRLGASSMAYCLSDDAQTRLLGQTERVVACFLMTDREREPKTSRCVHTTERLVQNLAKDAEWVFSRGLQITDSLVSLRAVGVTAPTCPGGQVAYLVDNTVCTVQRRRLIANYIFSMSGPLSLFCRGPRVGGVRSRQPRGHVRGSVDFPIVYAIASCGCRCATLFAQSNGAFPDGVTRSLFGATVWWRLLNLSGVSRSEGHMKLASPSFTGVLPVAVRTRVCGMDTDSVLFCIKSVIACREEFGVLLFSSCCTSRGFGVWKTGQL